MKHYLLFIGDHISDLSVKGLKEYFDDMNIGQTITVKIKRIR